MIYFVSHAIQAAKASDIEKALKREEERVEVLTKEVREAQLKLELEGNRKESAQAKLDFLRSKLKSLEDQKASLQRQVRPVGVGSG
jgi:chromosome segregation ATPase